MEQIAILAANGKGIVGCAAWILPDTLLTCVHVLRDGGYKRKQAENIRLRINGSEQTAKFIDPPWIEKTGDEFPPDEKLPEPLDVISLKLERNVSSGKPNLRILDRFDASKDFSAYGFPKDFQNGTSAKAQLASLPDREGLRQLNWISGQQVIDRGFSGAPVWDDKDTIVGMVISRWLPKQTDKHAPPVSFILPITSVSRLFLKYNLDFPPIRSAVGQRYPQADVLVKFAEDKRLQGPYKGKLRQHLFPMRILVSSKSAFASVERMHAGDSSVQGEFQGFSASEILLQIPKYLYIQAPGGAGKSYFTFEILIESLQQGIIPFYLSLAEAGTAINRVFQQTKLEDQLDALFSVCKAENGFKNFQASKDEPKVLVVDGINETTTPVDQILNLVHSIKANYSSVSLVVADRMSLRKLPSGFDLATIEPIALTEVDTALASRKNTTADSFKRVLTIPFFLDLYLADDPSTSKRSTLIFRYIDRILYPTEQLPDESEYKASKAIDSLAALAYTAYETKKGASIGPEELEDKAKTFPELRPNRLRDSGLMPNKEGDRLAFRHQLIHDALAARHFVIHDWHPDSGRLDALTMERKSHDALLFILEDVPERSHEVILGVYDWNYGIALSCVLSSRQEGISSLGFAICAVVAAKVDEPFLHTRSIVERRSETLQFCLGLAGGTLSENVLVQHVRGLREKFSDPQLFSWWKIFTAEEASSEVLDALLGNDPLIGWTAATTLRRVGINERDFSWLLRLLNFSRMNAHNAGAKNTQMKSGNEHTVRWRIVHVMGKIDQAAEQLATVAFDPKEHLDVRYGAARSLVEVVATASNESRSRSAIEKITEALSRATGKESIEDWKRVFSAFRACAILKRRRKDEPVRWRELYGPVLTLGRDIVCKIDKKECDKWNQQLEQFETDERSDSG